MLSNQKIRLCHSLLSIRTKYIVNCSNIHHNININVNNDNGKLCGKQFKQSVDGSTSSKAVNFNFANNNFKGCSILVTRGYCTVNMAIATYDEIKDLPNHPEKLLIDVREPNEIQETGQIPTSINIPLGDLEKQFQLDPNEFKAKYGRDKPTPATEIIFHCKLGGRAGKATDFATRVGFYNAKNYKGSWLEWAEKEGLPK